jgi:hypothetical protein
MTRRPSNLAQQDAGSPVSATRRRLLRGSLGTAPILMVSAPRSVMAGTGVCTQASSFASINASRPDVLASCSGKTPNWWRDADKALWPEDYKSSATKFSTIFGAPKGFNDTSLLNVLQFSEAAGPKCLARHMVAGALNAAAGWTPVQIASVPILKNIYASYYNKDYYEPTAGIRWYCDSAVPAGAGGITPWLQSTMV